MLVVVAFVLFTEFTLSSDCLGLERDCLLLSAAKLAVNAFSVHLHLCPDMAWIRKGSASDFVIKTLRGEVC